MAPPPFWSRLSSYFLISPGVSSLKVRGLSPVNFPETFNGAGGGLGGRIPRGMVFWPPLWGKGCIVVII